MIFDTLNQDWQQVLYPLLPKEYLNELDLKLQNEEYFPKKKDVFNALNLCSFAKTKVIIIGQDPYHDINQAHGLSFSVKNTKLPPSLKNIFKEIENDINIINTSGDLTSWAEQGVLLLNNVLTVKPHSPNSHIKYNWQVFTNLIIEVLSSNKQNLVFMLWGKNAQQKKSLITTTKHLILETSHPSFFSYLKGFQNCKHFSKANEYLIKHNKQAINWQTF